MKNALRFLALEPDDAVAIVVSADIAKHELGSSGEPTQGAGAVAMLLEAESLLPPGDREFVIDRIGDSQEPGYTDDGIEYYRYVSRGSTSAKRRAG